MIELQHVWVERDGRTLLADVDFEVDRGEFVYLVGATGTGKTTLLRLLMFAERPTRGVVFVGDVASTRVSERQIPTIRRRMGVVFQDFKLLRDRTVYENVAFALAVTGIGRREIKRRTLAVLSQTDLLHIRDVRPESLSGGERQRVAIARALVGDPHVLLADEPTANLDPESTDRVMRIFSAANARGTAILMATHDFGLVARHPRRTLSLADAHVVEVAGDATSLKRRGR